MNFFRRSFIGRESRPKTPHQMLLIKRLTKVTNDPIVQGAGAVNVVGVGSHEDRRNRVTRLDEVFMEFEPGHRRHMDVGDQAGGFGETRRCEEIGFRRKGRNVVAKRSHEPPHGLAKELIVLDDRDQRRSRHTCSGSAHELRGERADNAIAPACELINCAQE
jgi:hypothetical protein